jgi:hypothetical protein
MIRALRVSVVPVLIAAGVLFSSPGPARATDPSPPPAAAHFDPIARELLSPRCVNCHPAGDAPHVGDHGRLHPMNISRASEQAGLPCTSCHRAQNADRPHAPPGVPGWRMPPKETPMVFEGKSPRELCETLKDPTKNGGRTLAALEEHFATDVIVLWGFAPGPGRTRPPVPHDELVRHVKEWIEAGAPCP